MEKISDNEKIERVQNALKLLNSLGLDYTQISVLLDGRFSSRTLYRWSKGETLPQRSHDVVAIEELAKKCK